MPEIDEILQRARTLKLDQFRDKLEKLRWTEPEEFMVIAKFFGIIIDVREKSKFSHD